MLRRIDIAVGKVSSPSGRHGRTVRRMTVILNPYLNFRSNAREAIEFYQSVFGGELTVQTFGDLRSAQSPEEESLVMHAQLTAPSFTLMAADVPVNMSYERGNDLSVSLSGPSEDEATLRRYWDGLSEGAEIVEPLAAAPWGDTFGMLTDRFGVQWLVNIAAPVT